MRTSRAALFFVLLYLLFSAAVTTAKNGDFLRTGLTMSLAGEALSIDNELLRKRCPFFGGINASAFYDFWRINDRIILGLGMDMNFLGSQISPSLDFVYNGAVYKINNSNIYDFGGYLGVTAMPFNRVFAQLALGQRFDYWVFHDH